MKNNLNSNLLSKLNSQWQGFIDFMADGVADVGLERSSLVDKYLNELVNTNNPSNARAIESVVKARVINELLHFTPIDNLEQILKYGFIPRIYLQNSKILRATFPDSSRMMEINIVTACQSHGLITKCLMSNEERWVGIGLLLK